MKRGSPAVAVAAVSRGTHPLVSAPALFAPVFFVRLSRPLDPVRPVSDDERPKRLIPAGTYTITSPIVIEGELSEAQLRALFILVNGATVSVGGSVKAQVEPEPRPALSEKEERAAKFKEMVRGLVEAYRERLGEPTNDVQPSIGAWIPQYGEELIREGLTETAAAAVVGRQQRFEYLRDWLRNEHKRRLREEEGE